MNEHADLDLHCLHMTNCASYGPRHVKRHWATVAGAMKIQGPVVPRVVSLTSSLRVISLTVLVDSINNILKFFAEKM